MKTALLVFLLSSSLALAGAPVSFQQLSPGDSIHVKFTSSGCFHHVTYEFDFQRAATTTAKVTQIEQRRDETGQREVETKQIPLGTATLSGAELLGLDRLMTFYRSKHTGGCTTVDLITVTQKGTKGDKTTESFTDATCSTYDRKDLTLFSAIVAKLRPRTK